MRLFLLPISTRQNLIYCQRLNQQLTSKQTYVEKITNRASAVWIVWEGAEKGWRKKVTELGNNLFKTVPFQEWGLKSIPPLSARRNALELEGKEEVNVEYPPSYFPTAGSVLDVLHQLATERQALHRKRLWGSIIGMPFTIPVGLIPVIPNLPFFYLAWRAWSHWRAFSGSKHLEFLISHGLVNPVPSSELEIVYSYGASLAKLEEHHMHFEMLRNKFKDMSKRLKKRKMPGPDHPDFMALNLVNSITSRAEKFLIMIEHSSRDINRLLETLTKGKYIPDNTPPDSLNIFKQYQDHGNDPDVYISRNKGSQALENLVMTTNATGLFPIVIGIPELEIEVNRAVSQVQNGIELLDQTVPPDILSKCEEAMDRLEAANPNEEQQAEETEQTQSNHQGDHKAPYVPLRRPRKRK